MIIATLVGLTLLLLAGAPIAMALLAAAVLALQQEAMPLSLVPQRLFGTMDSFTLLAIPLFILAGELMNTSGITGRLIQLARTLVAHRRGGIGMVAVLSEYLVSGVSGSVLADTAAIGSTMVPAMESSGYRRDKAVGIVCGACAMGILVPPSISMVLYGGMANVSIGALFVAGFLPAFVTAVAMIVHLGLEARRLQLPVQPRASRGEVARAARDAGWALLMPAIIFAGIIGGVFTPTEAAVVAVVYALLIDRLVYRALSLEHIARILTRTVSMTGVIMFLIAASSVLAWYLTLLQLPQMLTQLVIGCELGPTIVMLGIVAIFMVMSTFMDDTATMIMVVPLLVPVMPALGLDALHMGVVIVASIGIGLFTPPVGAGLMVAASVGRVSLGQASRAMLPYLATVGACLLLIVCFPALVTAVPRALGL